MASDNGNMDPLQQIVGHLAALRSEMKNEFSELRSDINRRFAEVDVNLTKVNLRLDKLIDNSGEHYRKLEERVAALESKAH